MYLRGIGLRPILTGLLLGWLSILSPVGHADLADLADLPLFLGANGTPLSLLVMGRDHKLYYEAYNDASDLNQDGEIDVGYKPDLMQGNQPLDYYGYFDSHKCYSYDTANNVFTPTSVTLTKKCSNAWSGDFLNYLTTSRMDALRRVLYGGYRYTDTATDTVLERARIPQDAHSWGKEYTSVAHDGYNIADYAPLSAPQAGFRHLFANTSLSATGNPLLRVLVNSRFRIWEWVSIERPVAGDDCATGANSRSSCTNTGGNYDSYPNNHQDYDALVAQFANASHLTSTGSISTINKGSNTGDYYLTVITGTLVVATAGTYEVAVDGDDAVEVIIDGQVVAGRYGGHGKCSCQDHKGSITLSSGNHTLVFRHQEKDGQDNYYLYWKGPDSSNAWQIVPASSFSGLTQNVYNVTIPASTRTDYVVRVKACVSGLLEDECKGYPAGSPTVYKPSGLLHDYGETGRMAFGLLTGSYKKHLSGGILRKNIASFQNEVDQNTGQFILPSTGGSIRKAIDSLAVVGFDYGSYSYTDGGCDVPMTSPMQEGRCAMWGNPIAEMMYEGVRYFAGKTGPTSAFDFTNTGTFDESLGLPKPSWLDPYRSTAQGGYLECSRPFEVVIADIPSFDTDQIPGSFFNTFSGDLSPALDAQSIGQTIWNGESEAGKVFIGQSGNVSDGAPTPKDVTSFGNIRGLAPEEPTREGGFYAGSVAYYAKTHDLNPASRDQKMETFAVALSSPLPRIEIPMADDKIITLVPFAKSVGGCMNNSSDRPTNTIVDFYVEKIVNTGSGNIDASTNGGRPYGKFRINYEDSEYGSDHDMDAIATYEVIRNADNTLTVNLSSDYAAGCIIQHMGYVISGTTKDGVYLEVRDLDTNTTDDANADYFLDTPSAFQGIPPAPATGTGTWDDNIALPLTASRTFTPGTTASAKFIKHDPLWYAAKWGGFIEADKDSNNLPDKQSEWDANNDGKPDSYFLVTNAGKLKQQLSDTFKEITDRTSSAAAVTQNTGSLSTNSRLYQARFKSADWSGELISYLVNADGSPGLQEWKAQDIINGQDFNTGRKIITFKPSTKTGIPFRWPSNPASPGSTELDAAQITALKAGGTDTNGSNRLDYLRGSATNEGQNKAFRQRSTRLGDIVNSNPFYVGPPVLDYPDTLESAAYSAFRTTHANRTPIVYVGGNDGLLHGFDASIDSNNQPTVNSGKELIAYAPSTIYAEIAAVSKQDYNTAEHHRYFVDGSPTGGDAFYGSAWHTVLVGSLRKGGKGFFALDVTNPSNFAESNAANLVLWEFTSADDGDLGYSFSQPSIIRMHNGKWAAIFGNGYNSTATGHAVLFIVDIATGGDTSNGGFKVKLDTGVGSTGTPNGLATPTAVDTDGDAIIDLIYAGDLQGNLWRFDVSDSSTSSWTSSLLFTASVTTTDASNNTVVTPQPITSAPQVTTHPLGGYIVLFGTGQYLGKSDVATTGQQTFFGIWDDNGATISGGRSDLQQQTFETNTLSVDSNTFRLSSQNAVDWTAKKGWYIDLPAARERVVTDSLLIGSRITFTSIAPAEDPCDFGGASWFNVLDATTGGRAATSFLTGGTNPTAIKDTGGNAPTSIELEGISSAPTVMADDGTTNGRRSYNVYVSLSTSAIRPIPMTGEDLGRQSWRQLEFH